MHYIHRLFFSLLWISGCAILPAYGQTKAPAFNLDQKRTLRSMFYNVENAFDTINDPLPGDDDFIPSSGRHWNGYKYRQKIKSIYKVIVTAGGWEPPGLIGLCEIENKKVLEDLVHQTPLSKYQYQIIHDDSPDYRGIDIAALYLETKFQPIAYQYIPVPLDKNEKTRDILYLKGRVKQSDTLHVFFNHWPSKWQGAYQTQPKRIKAAQILWHHIDSLFSVCDEPLILAAGDFNEGPRSSTMMKHLHIDHAVDNPVSKKLYNLSASWRNLPFGTYKYRGIWEIIDQFIVSGSLLTGDAGLTTSPNNAHILHAPFLLTEDKKFTGEKPFRTYSGYRYQGGFSDHLPVILDFHH